MQKVLFLLIFMAFLLACSLSAASSAEDSVIDTALNQSVDSLEAAATVSEQIDPNFVYPMPPERKELLISYSRFKNIWRFASFFIGVVLLGIILFTGLSAKIRNLAQKVTGKRAVHWLIYIILFMVVLFIINLPFDYYRNFLVEHDYGFSNQTGGEWFAESLKSLVVTIIFSCIILGLLYWLINRFKRWWLYFAVGMIPIAVLMIIIVPVVVSPMFNKFEPLKDEQLAAKMTQLANKAGIQDPDIYQVDASKQSKKINAYFTGMFGTRRIVLYDNMINNFSHEEIEFVMGHEIGHFKMYHIWKGLFIAVIIVFAASWLADRLLPRIINRFRRRLGFEKLGDIASIPLLILFITVFSFITQPFQNTISRIHEYDSDEYGLRLSGVTAEDAVRTFDKLSVFNLSDPAPSPIIEFWFYDHPALYKRMDFVRNLYEEIIASP